MMKKHQKVLHFQCDLMDSLFVEYLAIYSIQNLPNNNKSWPIMLKFLHNTELTMWQYFTKSGHIVIISDFLDASRCWKNFC